jgi:hypothetical protein
MEREREGEREREKKTSTSVHSMYHFRKIHLILGTRGFYR